MPYDPISQTGYTPRASPIVYTSSEEFTIYNSPANGTDDKVLTINVNRRGKIVGFIATATHTGAGGPGPNDDALLVKVRKNGQVLSTQMLDYTDPVYGANIRGLFFVETLGLLTGAEVQDGDKFELAFEGRRGGSATFVIYGAITLIVQEF